MMEEIFMKEHYELIRDKVIPTLEEVGYKFTSDTIFKMIDSADYTIDLLKNIYSRYNSD